MTVALRVIEGDDIDDGEAGSISQAADEGTPRDVLLQLRRRIARTLDDPKTLPRDLAALSRRLMEIDKQIRAIDAQDAERVRQEETEASEDDEGLGDV